MDIIQLAMEAGLDLVGVAPVGPSPDWQHYHSWVESGYAEGLSYLTRPDVLLKRKDPRNILPETKSVIIAAVPYGQGKAPEPQLFEGAVSRYAWSKDYHNWLLERLKTLVKSIEHTVDVPLISRCYVDTGPVLERSWAQKAGLGWIGKNTCLINPQLGSYIFLGVILINLNIKVSTSPRYPTCGSCVRCLEACPTGALIAPGLLDARRCLSFLTIENRGIIPVELRNAVGNRVFGCDVCQEVCPWNRKHISSTYSSKSDIKILNLKEVLEMDANGFKQRFQHSPIWRATPVGLARNAAVVLGNQRGSYIAAYIHKMTQNHPNALVREHLSWAARVLKNRS